MRNVLAGVLVIAALAAGGWFAFFRGSHDPNTEGTGPAVLLNAKPVLFSKKDNTLTGAIDVQEDADVLARMAVPARKESLLRAALDLAAAQARDNPRLAGAEKVKINVVRITNKNEYAQGEFRGM